MNLKCYTNNGCHESVKRSLEIISVETASIEIVIVSTQFISSLLDGRHLEN